MRLRLTIARVAGGSMAPALRDGDVVLVGRPRALAIGDVVIAAHPERRDLVMVKRVTRIEGDGTLWLEGDAGTQSHDSWVFGAVPFDLVRGRVLTRIGFPRRS